MSSEEQVDQPAVDDGPVRMSSPRRTWTQRALLAVNVIVITACFAGAIGLVVARNLSNRIGRVELAAPTATSVPPVSSVAVASPTTISAGTVAATTSTPASTPETFPPADPTARNFLITGADNNACVDPDSPYASAFGNREGMGERSDTIMLMRVDPATGRAAVLSFPRDLWVEIAGRGSKQRINTAYVKDDPQRLIDTLYLNFGLGVDHFIQVDFCAFKNIVDAVGGVAVPFIYPARDKNSGLDVPEAGCFTFDGDHALAYVRSRYYQYYDGSRWRSDPVSDLGRVSRQQDFIRRAMSAALDKGVLSPSVARGLIKTAEENVVVDNALTPSMMLEFVGVLRSLDPTTVASYQIDGKGANMGGASVLIPQLDTENMRSVLSIFRGETPLASAPLETVPSDSAVPVIPTTAAGSPTTAVGGAGPGLPIPTTVAPAVPEENTKGIVPPRDVEC